MTEHEGNLALLQSNMREQYEAFCAMRNDINEIIGDMESAESTLRNGPEMAAECEAVVKAVAKFRDGLIAQNIAALNENTAAMQWLGSVMVDLQILLRER